MAATDGGDPAVNATSLLEVEGLRTEIRLRSRTVRAVDGVSLSVSPDETPGIVGTFTATNTTREASFPRSR